MKMKKIVWRTMLILLLFIFVFVSVVTLRLTLKNNFLSKSEIFSTVNENYNLIANDIKNNTFDKTLQINGIEDVKKHNEAIEFYCGGKGNVASGVYYGFYYSNDSLPKVSFMSYLFYDESDLIKEKDGFSCSEVDYYYTEKIKNNFYYYEAHY